VRVSDANYLGFDYGEERIGVATGQLITRSASPLETLHATNRKPDWAAIARLVEAWHPTGFVVGIPVHMDGSRTRITEKAQRFARQLNGRFGRPVYHCDERLSTAEANALIVSARRAGTRGRTKRGDDDKISAALILQQWLENYDGDS
jgi:putative Holliday junction resolvase